MEQTCSENLQLGRLVADARDEIERLGYSRRSRSRYRATWQHLIELSREKGLGDEFSANLLTRFLEEHRAMDEQVNGPGNDWRRHMAIGVKVLADFARTGRIERAVMDVQSIDLLPAMQNTLRDYEQYCKDRLHTCSRRRSRESYPMCVPFSDFSPCVEFCKKTSVRSCRKSAFPGMQRFRRCGIRNSSSGFSVRSIAVPRKGNAITPSSCWHAGWDCALEIFAP